MLQYVIIASFSLLIAAYLYLRTVPEQSRPRRIALALLRALSVGILLLLLISPIIYYYHSRKDIPEIILLSDSSSSMALKTGGSAKSTYLNSLKQRYKDIFSKAGYKISEYNFAEGLEGSADNSLLAPALESLADKHDLSKVSGIVLASDGWLRDESLTEVERSGIPFYVLADTTSVRERDLSLTKTQNNRYAYRNETTIIRAELNSQGYSGNADLILKISGKEVSRKAISLESGKPAAFDFSQRFAQTGFFPYTVEVSAPGAGERTLANNLYPGAVEVLSDKEQIVIISDNPGWDNKFIRDVIGENPRWEAAHYTLKGDQLLLGEKPVAQIGQNSPAALVVINNGGLKLSPAINTYITRTVSRGTGLLFIGQPVQGLEAILPVHASNITAPYSGFLNWTPAAEAYPMLALDSQARADIPPVDYYYVTANAGAEIPVTISNPQNSPAVSISLKGNAKTIAFSFLNLWKWQMQSSTGAYKKLINSVLTWLSNRSAGNYQAIYNSSYFRGEEIRIKLRVDDDIRQIRLDLNPLLKVWDASDKEVFSDYLTASGDDYELKLELDKAGQYRFEIGEKGSKEKATGRFSISDNTLEARDFDYNLPLLAWIANQTGGKLIARDMDYRPVPAEITTHTETKEIPLYRRWYILSLFILAFSVELFLRRRWGLL